MDIHNYKRRLERTLNKIEKSAISDKNKKLVLGFHDNCFTEGLSLPKIERYLFDLHKLAEMIGKDMSKATKQDLQKIVAEIEKKQWSPHTKHAFKIMIRKFFRWVEGIDEKGVYPERVKWLHSNIKNNQQKLPGELLNEDEVGKMICCADNPRDRALVAILYESGCRISEIGLLKIKDIASDEYGVKIMVAGKTGARRVRLVNSAPVLQEWLNKHPDNKNPDSYVWVGKNRRIIGYTRFSEIIKSIALKAGIRKRIYPHLFRHSRATHLAKFLTEAQMKDYLGWTQSSKMAAIYVHLSGRDTDVAILRLNGIKIQEEAQEKKLQLRICPRCKTVNEFSNKFCKTCGMVIDEQEKQEIMRQDLKRSEMDGLMNDLIKDKEFLEFMLRKIREKSAQ